MTAQPKRNPYRPGVGLTPPFLAGRDGTLRRFEAMLRAAPEQPANMRITGLRGVGKTVLLKEFEERAAKYGWVVRYLELGPDQNTDTGLTATVTELAAKAQRDISRIQRARAAAGAVASSVSKLRFTWNDVTVSFDPAAGGGAGQEIAKPLFETCQLAARKQFEGVMLLLDEAQVVRDEKGTRGSHPLSALLTAVVALQRREIRLGLVLSGLPTLAGNFLRARSYTERMFRGEEIGRLHGNEARQALIEPLKNGPITADPSVIDDVVGEVDGYPYFIQLWGCELWDSANLSGQSVITRPLLRVTREDIYHRLDADFYAPRISTLTPAEQDLLLATVETPSYPPLHASDMQDVSNKSPANINVLLGRLVEAGVLYRLRKGEYDYTAPRFREYLERRARLV